MRVFIRIVFDPLRFEELQRGFVVAQITQPRIASFLVDLGMRTIKPFGEEAAVATFNIKAHIVDAVEAKVEPSAVCRDDLWPEGDLALVLGEAREYRADLDFAGDADAVAPGILSVMDLAHVCLL